MAHRRCFGARAKSGVPATDRCLYCVEADACCSLAARTSAGAAKREREVLEPQRPDAVRRRASAAGAGPSGARAAPAPALADGLPAELDTMRTLAQDFAARMSCALSVTRRLAESEAQRSVLQRAENERISADIADKRETLGQLHERQQVQKARARQLQARLEELEVETHALHKAASSPTAAAAPRGVEPTRQPLSALEAAKRAIAEDDAFLSAAAAAAAAWAPSTSLSAPRAPPRPPQPPAL